MFHEAGCFEAAAITMRFLAAVAVLCGLFSNCLPVVAESSQLVWPKALKPAQSFKNVNLVRSINLEKGYVRETINVVVQNIAKQSQSDYFLPFPSDVVPNIGGLEVRDKKDPKKGRLHLELSETDPSRLVLASTLLIVCNTFELLDGAFRA